MHVCNKGSGGGLQKLFFAPLPPATAKCHLLEKTRNSGWQIKWFTPFRSGRCRKYGM